MAIRPATHTSAFYRLLRIFNTLYRGCPLTCPYLRDDTVVASRAGEVEGKLEARGDLHEKGYVPAARVENLPAPCQVPGRQATP